MAIISILGALVVFCVAYQKEEQMQSWGMFNAKMKKAFPYLILIIISTIMALGFDTSPFKRSGVGIDSAVYIYIGKAINNGLIPYKDLFDHKGFVLYFIEAVGIFIGGGSKIGIWVIELFNIFSTCVILYKTAKLITKKSIVCLVSVYLAICFSVPFFFEGGNLVEEYALPWISLSIYYVIIFFIKGTYKKWYVALIGFSFAVVFMLRVNMVGACGALVLFVLVRLFREKRYVDISKCIFLFMSGCLVVFIPIVIYLMFTNSFNDFVDCYYMFNFRYTSSSSKLGIIWFALICIEGSALTTFFILYSLGIASKYRYILYINIASLIITYFSEAVGGRGYLHYGIIFIPFFLIPTVIAIEPVMEMTRNHLYKIEKKYVLITVVFLGIISILLNPISTVRKNITSNDMKDDLDNYLINSTLESDDVLILGNNVNYYLDSNRTTKNRFFYQFPPVEVSEKMYKKFISCLSDEPSDYIIDTKSKYSAAGKRYYYIITYLNDECKKGKYNLKKYKSFNVYEKNSVNYR